MLDRLCSVVMHVLVLVLLAALSALFCLCLSVHHVVDLMSARMGAAQWSAKCFV